MELNSLIGLKRVESRYSRKIYFDFAVYLIFVIFLRILPNFCNEHTHVQTVQHIVMYIHIYVTNGPTIFSSKL